MPNITNAKNQHDSNKGGSRGMNQVNKAVNNGQVLLLNTESMDRETNNTSKVGG